MKSERQAAILNLISKQDIETQEQMAQALTACGIVVTQATVSRDIKELRLIKIMSQTGGYKYATVDKAEHGMADRFTRIFSESALSAESAGNLVVIKTLTGAANAACEAIDAMKWPGVIGTVAGDNTLLLIAKNKEAAQGVIRHFKTMIK